MIIEKACMWYATVTNDRLQKFTLSLFGSDAYKRAADKIETIETET